MLIDESIVDRVEKLSEMEFSELLRNMARIIERNKWESIIDDCFDIDTYEIENEELQREVRYLEERNKTGEDMSEDKLAEKLSSLNPMEYSQLMGKVKRNQWEITGFKLR